MRRTNLGVFLRLIAWKWEDEIQIWGREGEDQNAPIGLG
jgi:hypothetical protein